MRVDGLVLAAGAGERMGRPKALMVDADGEPWVARAVRVLRDGGCDDVSVVLGAAADEARDRVPQGADVVVAERWGEGVSASLTAGLGHVMDTEAEAVLVHLVDLPDVSAEVVRRVLARGVGSDRLARAVYSGRPGHPVLIGRDHWVPLLAGVSGDRGAAGYLRSAGAEPIECGDLACGDDVDHRLS